MGSFEVLIKESNVTYNAKTVREDGKFIRIAEMTIDVLLFSIWTGGSGWGHETISHFVGVNFGFILVIGFESSDQGIQGFGVVFGDIKLNARSVKGQGLG